jgi:hypothetical protein
MSTCYEPQIVGIDLHRRHTVIVWMSAARGERLGDDTDPVHGRGAAPGDGRCR